MRLEQSGNSHITIYSDVDIILIINNGSEDVSIRVWRYCSVQVSE